MRFYKTQEGLFPSVTTLLGATKSRAALAGLKKAQERCEEENGPGSWEQKLCVARQRGEIIHSLAEALLMREAVPDVPQEIECYATALERFLKDYSVRGIHCEFKVKSVSRRYAGRVDALVSINGVTSILDFKTFQGYPNPYRGCHVTRWQVYPNSQSLPSNPGWKWVKTRVREALLQLVAYKLATEEMGIARVPSLCVAVLCGDGEYQLVPLQVNHWQCAVAELLGRIERFHALETQPTEVV